MEPDAVSHYREAGVNFLLMDAVGLQIETVWGLGSRCGTQLFREVRPVGASVALNLRY